MCGIVGYLGKKKNSKKIIGKLQNLEYRGYDSAGIAVLKDDELVCYKQVGCISELEKEVPDNLETTCAIAHTRWATHGKSTVVNAHPHSSNGGLWTLVHNGIVENYLEIKQTLKNKIESETDSAVVAQLLEEKNVNSIEEFMETFSSLVGSYSIVAINKNKPNELFLAKNKSPLYVAENEGDYLVASDPICFVGVSKEYYEFYDNDFAHIDLNGIKFYANGKEIKKQKAKLDDSFESFSNAGFEHFMLKEICEEPEALNRQVKFFKEHQVLEKFPKDFMSKFNEVVFVGCGTAYHAALFGANYFRKQLNIKASAEIASEFIYSKPIFADEKMLFVLVSQSGETADTLMAAKIAKEGGATTLALTNVLYSSLAKRTDYIIPVCAGPEIAVASTKAYTCQLSALYMFASHLKNYAGGNVDYFADILRVAEKALTFDMKKVERIAEEIKDETKPIFIGKDLDYITAMEASLKLKEVSYINSTNYSSGELKHGFLALVEEGTPLFVFCSQSDICGKSLNASHEAISRGARQYLVTNIKQENEDDVIFIDEENELIASILMIIPMQYLAYKVSISKGINPDKPRNLAKSVTVE
ncbi:MAG: glutamine--fructose-6-phosphate transaminase (isomerizing) [Clostridia bacterium]|nr:glutamine--fructose-6-phosphate transaminase (isomerizing) [Clostridia bacterium]